MKLQHLLPIVCLPRMHAFSACGIL